MFVTAADVVPWKSLGAHVASWGANKHTSIAKLIITKVIIILARIAIVIVIVIVTTHN